MGLEDIKGKMIFLEDIENPVLKRVLCKRVKGDKFNFYDDEDYTDFGGYSDTSQVR